MKEERAIAETWLKAFESRVRLRDYEGGRKLFERSVLGYGSRLNRADGLDPLVEGQWKRVWPNIEGYRFLLEELRIFGTAASGILTLAAPWTSIGFDEHDRRFSRPGRSTLVIRRGEDGMWRCIHSHYSLSAGVPQNLKSHPPDGVSR
jgi:hypothetical protein